MIIGRDRFNIYLLCSVLALGTTLLCGCRTHKNDKDNKDNKDKELASLRVHIEATADDPMGTAKAEIYRASPVEMQVEKEPFLTESDVQSARVVNALGSFELLIQFNREGTWMLQNFSASNSGKHFAIFCQWGEKSKHARWLAAPSFSKLVSNGILQFTPDASHEEAEEIARGLNNFAKKNELNQKW